VSALWVSVSTTVIAFAFVFGELMRNTFDSIFLLFFIHPFDVGDSIILEGIPGIRLGVVKKLGLHTTELENICGQVVFVSTAQLSKSTILNLTRSHGFWTSIKLSVDFGFSSSQLKQLEEDVIYLFNSDPVTFNPSSPYVCFSSIDAPLKVEIKVVFEMLVPWGQWNMTKSRIFSCIKASLTKMGVAAAFTTYEGVRMWPGDEGLEIEHILKTQGGGMGGGGGGK